MTLVEELRYASRNAASNSKLFLSAADRIEQLEAEIESLKNRHFDNLSKEGEKRMELHKLLAVKDFRIGQLEADLKAARRIIDEENKDHIQQLAAHEATIKTMREALEVSVEASTRAHFGCSNISSGAHCNEARQIARASMLNLDTSLSAMREALSLPAPTDHLMAYRSEVLEEAAKVCDRFQERDVGMQPVECAGAIRAMKEKK